MTQQSRRRIGRFLAEHRRHRGWKLEHVSRMTGISVSTLSKVESKGQISFDTLLRLAKGLGINVSEILDSGTATHNGRRAVTRADEAQTFATDQYDYAMHAGDIRAKRMVPLIMHVRARAIEEFEQMSSHAGEEWIYVLEGSIVMHTEYYAPLRLQQGDSVYFDSSMPHAFVADGGEDAKLLSMCAGPSIEQLEQTEIDAVRERTREAHASQPEDVA